MNPYTMVFLIVLVVSISQTIRIIAMNSGSKREATKYRSLENRLEAIENRMSNLETITTSKDYLLNQEFEKLEDKTSVS